MTACSEQARRHRDASNLGYAESYEGLPRLWCVGSRARDRTNAKRRLGPVLVGWWQRHTIGDVAAIAGLSTAQVARQPRIKTGRLSHQTAVGLRSGEDRQGRDERAEAKNVGRERGGEG